MKDGIDVSVEIYERFLMYMASGQHHFAETPVDVQSDRELEVFEFTGIGHGTRENAERLQFSIRTVESYRTRIKNKPNLINAAERILNAVQWVESESGQVEDLIGNLSSVRSRLYRLFRSDRHETEGQQREV